ncbi:MAG: sugar phosphate isomerase/epimerase [Clostridia bacterium]|nr:sugar phosphate isomerase/epimerase [Clostridia bacterium]
MRRKLGIISECIIGMDSIDALDLIKAAGFECYFTGHIDDDTVSKLVKKGNSLGLTCEFIHAPFRGINHMWLAGMDYLGIMNGMKQAIDTAAKNGVPTVIVHVSSGWNAPDITELGLARFDELVLYATERKVTVAFENLRMIGNLAYFADRYANMEYVRFCYDSGHEHCYTKTVCWMDIFREKMVATHIHDNLGRGDVREGDPDLHLLPFDGNVDYVKMMRKLDEYHFTGPLILEVSTRRCPEVEPKAFLADCYARIQKISNL